MIEITKIAPVIRGLTYDGRSGAIVTFDPGDSASEEPGASTDETVVIDGSKLSDVDEIEEAAATIVEAYGQTVAQTGTRPRIVRIKGVGRFCISDVPPAIAGGGAAAGGRPAGGSRDKATADPRIAGRIVVVTGGAQGFGEEIARAMVARGAYVVIADLNREGAEALAAELNDSAGETAVALGLEVNVADEGSVRKMMESIVRAWGGVDLFVSNAGVLRAGSVKDLSIRDFEFVTSVNYSAFFLCTKHVAPVMALQNFASGAYFTDIIQINSKSGLAGSNKNGAYAGAKFGGIGLVQSFAMELVTDNIKVNAVCPGNFFEGPLWSDPEKGLFVQYLNAGKVPGAKSVEDVRHAYEQKVPMRRGCRGEDVVKAILYLVEQAYETGQALPVTGGQVMLK